MPPPDTGRADPTGEGTLHNSVTVTGGTHIGGATGAGSVDNHARIRVRDVSTGTASAPTTDDLQAALLELDRLLAGSGVSTEQRADLAYEVRKIREELASDVPDGAPVRGRWAEIGRVLAPVLGTGTALAEAAGKITDLIRAVFPTG